MATNPKRPGIKSARFASVDSDNRQLASTLYPATDFIASPSRLSTRASVLLPITMEGLNSMREKLLVHDKFFMKFIGSSRDTVAMKSSLQELFIAYQTAFNTLVTGYAQVANQLSTSESCRSTIIKTCAGISRTCVSSVQDAATKIAQSQTSQKSFAAAVKSDPKIRVPRGPTVAISKSTTSFIIAPTTAALTKFPDSNSTKNALYKAVNPVDVDLRVERVMRAGGSEVLVEARTVNLDRLRSSEALARAGLQVKDDHKFNPRLLVLGVPRDMTREEVRRDLIHQNLEGKDNPDIKIVYMYAPSESSAVTRCVLEVPADVRARLLTGRRIYLGFSSCAIRDHIRVRHCYRCLTFGHVSTDCSREAHCGHCAGDHEMRGCPNRSTGPVCYNCRSNNLADYSHAALDGNKCTILKRRLTNKVHMTNYG